MVIFFDKYTDNTRKLQESMQYMGIEAKIIVLEYSNFLPDEILTPHNYFIQSKSIQKNENGLFYDFLDVPEFWEIRWISNDCGAVYDMGCKKATIYFEEPKKERKIQRVEWNMENGWVYKIDFYNKCGMKYVSEFLDANRKVEAKIFYSDKNREIIVEQPKADTVTLLDNGKVVALFTSYNQFVEYYVNKAELRGNYVLFIQSEDKFNLLNYKFNGQKKWKYIFFSNDKLLKKYIDMGGENGYRFCAVQLDYPENSASRNALILTASDQLEGIEYLIATLQDMVFHIAANTQVSEKIYNLAKYANVKIYPQISTQKLKTLWNICDFYLDINYYREIYNAINTAHQNNLLIMGFEDTLHDRRLILEECIFSKSDYKGFALAVKKLSDNPSILHELLEKQHRKKSAIWKNIEILKEITEE